MGKEMEDFLSQVFASTFLGNDEFIEWAKEIRRRLALQRYLINYFLDIYDKVCHTTRQLLKKEAGHATSHSRRRTPLPGPEV